MHTVFKQETALFHRRLNSLPNVRAIVKPELNAAQYVRVLSAFAQAYSLLEPKMAALETKIQLGALQNYVPRLASILHDITSFGENPLQQYLQNGGDSGSVDVWEESHYFGLRYVLDGTSQGGKYIEQRLRKNAPQLVERSFSFWSVQQTVAGQWPLLCKAIAELAKDDDCRRKMISTANETFQLFIECCSFPEQKS